MVKKKNIYLYKGYYIRGIFEMRVLLFIGIFVYLRKNKKMCSDNAES